MANDTMTHDAPATSVCPRCTGTGRVKFTRPGGWLLEPCTPCSGSGRVDPETAGTLRVLIRNGTAALGDVDGKCCDPTISDPCIACVPPDDVPYEPTPEDEAWYRGLCRERDARLLSERMAADEDEAYRAMQREESDGLLLLAVRAALKVEGFQEMLAAFANAFADHGRADVRWVGVKIGGLYDQARLLLEAKSGEQFDERLACHLDGIEAAHAAC